MTPTHEPKNEKCPLRNFDIEIIKQEFRSACTCKQDREKADHDVAQQITEKMLEQGTPWN